MNWESVGALACNSLLLSLASLSAFTHSLCTTDLTWLSMCVFLGIIPFSEQMLGTETNITPHIVSTRTSCDFFIEFEVLFLLASHLSVLSREFELSVEAVEQVELDTCGRG